MKKIAEFLKKDTVLSAAWILAVISAFFVRPDRDYIGYIDFRSLGTLWSLMVIVAGLNRAGLFTGIGKILLGRVRYIKQLVLVLVLLPFFFSMFITNDVALLTFVPFAIYILKLSRKEGFLVPVVVLQTLAANLGSMFTPIGNPQNLYLYGISGMDMPAFLKLMLPYTAAALVLLLICILFFKSGKDTVTAEFEEGEEPGSRRRMVLYTFLFVFALISVAFPAAVSYLYVVAAVLAVFLITDRKLLLTVDYSLLLTFVGFFIFTGNLSRIEAVRNFMTSMVRGREVLSGILFSQLISNVPAALLLANFAGSIRRLIIGVNLGGLGTLIASMASLISYKLLVRSYPELRSRYFGWFTAANAAFLIVLSGVYLIAG